MTATGSRTIQRVTMPTTDCTVFCSFLTAGSSLNVRANQTHAIVALSTYFKLQFEYITPSVGQYPSISNILDLQDVQTGQSLLSVSLPWTTNTVVDYNGNQVEAWGPQLVSNYQTVYTTITIVVQAGTVTITSSSNPGWIDTKYVSTNCVTTGRLFYLYLSNPNLDFNHPAQTETRPSAGGTIRNIIITSMYILHVSYLHCSLGLSVVARTDVILSVSCTPTKLQLPALLCRCLPPPRRQWRRLGCPPGPPRRPRARPLPSYQWLHPPMLL